MRLMRWVEVHLGRSRRRKSKKEDAPCTPLRKVEPLGAAPLTPRRPPTPQPRLHIRTSFVEPGPSPEGSPRQRSRIRTNPWLPSPRGPDWARRLGPAEAHDGPLPRVTLGVGEETRPRGLPRSAWMDFRALDEEATRLAEESSDEAYSEDFEAGSEEAEPGAGDEAESPQADSACGSSCSTTPLGEAPAAERLGAKVARLRAERRLVDRRLREAREEELERREERLALQRELVQFRRLLLLQTLAELREQLERRSGKRLHRRRWPQEL